MTNEQIKNVHQARPFRPFTMRLADERKVHVPHPEFFWLHPGGRTAIAAGDGDGFEIVDLPLIAAVEVGNGEQTER